MSNVSHFVMAATSGRLGLGSLALANGVKVYFTKLRTKDSAEEAAMADAVLKAHHRVVHAQARSDWRAEESEGGAGVGVHELMF